jgi:hypothetical protein
MLYTSSFRAMAAEPEIHQEKGTDDLRKKMEEEIDDMYKKLGDFVCLLSAKRPIYATRLYALKELLNLTDPNLKWAVLYWKRMYKDFTTLDEILTSELSHRDTVYRLKRNLL